MSDHERREHLEHVWLIGRVCRLLRARGVDVSLDDAKAVADYVCEQEMARAIETARGFKHSQGLHDILLLTAIMRLGHAPKHEFIPPAWFEDGATPAMPLTHDNDEP
jgi:hypothetical protein